MNKDPDYSAAYLELTTEQGQKGYSLVFTIGRGNELCCKAIESMSNLFLGYDLEAIKRDFSTFYQHLKSDSQLRWLGPEKGVTHMALGAVTNAVWDMWARSEDKPLWKLVCDFTPEQLANCLDYNYVTDALTRDEAVALFCNLEATKNERVQILKQSGYPAYTTSAGWLGYSDEKLKHLCADAARDGFRHIKLKVGIDLDSDIRRLKIAREALGDQGILMVDANQNWEVNQAIEWMKQLEEFNVWFIEEPTSPDDIAGHAKIRRALNKTQVATGEHCQNRIIFKQLIVGDAIDVVQIDACRVGGLNELLTIYTLAAKYGKLVCPHAGGVGLCEYVQHLSMIDYVCISGEIGDRVIEYVDHLHEHFEDPCVVENGAYRMPHSPGFSIKMHDATRQAYCYPHGPVWRLRRNVV